MPSVSLQRVEYNSTLASVSVLFIYLWRRSFSTVSVKQPCALRKTKIKIMFFIRAGQQKWETHDVALRNNGQFKGQMQVDSVCLRPVHMVNVKKNSKITASRLTSVFIPVQVVSFQEETTLLCLSISIWPVSLWQASSHNVISHSLITDPVLNTSLLNSPETPETQSNMMPRLKSETFCGSHQMNHAYPLCTVPFTPLLASVILARQGPCMHTDVTFRFSLLWAMCHKHLLWEMSKTVQTDCQIWKLENN